MGPKVPRRSYAKFQVRIMLGLGRLVHTFASD
jgi:hypothetical protein